MPWLSRASSPTPEPAQRVSPLTKERVAAIFDERGWRYSEDDDGDLTAVWDGDFFSYLLRGDNNEILNVLGYIKEDIPMTRLDEARFALDEWHRDHLWPTAFWRENDDAGLTFSIGAAVAIDWEHGVTDKQIYLQLDCAMSTILKCFDDVRSRLGMEQPN